MEAQESKKYLQELAHKIKESVHLTIEEQDYFDKWYNSYADELLELPENYAPDTNVIRDRMLAKIEERIRKSNIRYTSTRSLWSRIAVAATLLLFISVGAYFILGKRRVPEQVSQIQYDIKPGKNQATLTLANGQKIILTKGLNGKLAQQGNTSIAVSSSNAITYTTVAKNAEVVTYNTLSTARGEQSPYPLILSDGTKVWLDAASTITFPTVFNGKSRLVKITGQAYFEVAHNAAQPFKVSVRDLTVEDIGTQFNINAYEDEPAIRTSLLNGAVRVVRQAGQQSVVLSPGQDAVAASRLSVKEGDPEESTAWKNGYFRFNDENIQGVMRQLARWYNIDVIYVGTPPSVGFNAHISRYKNISQVLKVLELTKMVKFQVEERRVMVKQ